MASSTSVTITIRGKGAHGAWPHRTVDPIVLASFLVLDLQTIVSHEIEPGEPAVVTVGSIHGGTEYKIIPDEVRLELTLRSFSEAVRQHLIAGIKRRTLALASAHQAPEPSVEIEESTSPPPKGASVRRSLPETGAGTCSSRRISCSPWPSRSKAVTTRRSLTGPSPARSSSGTPRSSNR
jgi:metal-dependent amidase/aminoacylase/carboxypeptidase family protein